MSDQCHPSVSAGRGRRACRLRHRAFTLVELLVVVTILVVLASLLFPALSAAKATAHNIRCVSNLRRICVAYLAEASDRDRGLLNEAEDPATFWRWLRKTVQPPGSAICPLAPRKLLDLPPHTIFFGSTTTAWEWEQHEDSQPQRFAGSYTMNGWFSAIKEDGRWGVAMNCFTSEADISHASATPLFGDGTTPINVLSAASMPPRNLAGGSGFLVPRHGARPRTLSVNHPPEEKLPGAMNMVFYDGHVEQVPLEKLWSLYWHKDYIAPAKRPGLK